ncbi:hypothetical protein [Lentibacter sp. XHP0401]|uniref:hypothetical protein n=1 Tax=Lentibacter sp. XHP0401 TaxID=2984334 RepID=UPI0021E971D3|nr:hypothetical protein [Lentibacter sp. XHP0401]MCV2893442.1 hypothetical protein [Lentibacter sp. XHP0401]
MKIVSQVQTRTPVLAISALFAFLLILFPDRGAADNKPELPPLPEHLTLPDCELGPECPIPFDHLSNQESEPFLFATKLIDENHPRWSQFEDALEQFPDVGSCLVEDEASKESPNLLLMDWKKTGYMIGSRVCLFRVASSLDHPTLVQQWMKYHGFRVGDIQPVLYPARPEKKTRFVGSWTATQYRKRNPHWFVSLTGFETVRSWAYSISFNSELRVMDVRPAGSSTFNLSDVSAYGSK